MANAEDMAIVKQGTIATCKWQEGNSSQRLDLHRAELNAVRLDGVNLSDAVLAGASMRWAELREETRRRRQHLRRFVLVLVTLCFVLPLSGCVVPPPAPVIGIWLAPTIALLAAELWHFAGTAGHVTFKTQALVIILLYFVYLVPVLTLLPRWFGGTVVAIWRTGGLFRWRGRARLHRPRLSQVNAYAASVIDALASGAVVAAGVWACRRFWPVAPRPAYALAGTSLFFFVLNLGYYFTMQELEAVKRDAEAERKDNSADERERVPASEEADQEEEDGPASEQRPRLVEAAEVMMYWSHLHYTWFILAPVAASVFWLWTRTVPKPSILRLDVAVLAGGLATTIALAMFVKATELSSAHVPSRKDISTDEYEQLYRIMSDARHILLYDNLHDLLIVGLILIGAWAVLEGLPSAGIVWPALITAGTMAALIGFVPFYFGQRKTLEVVVDRIGGSAAQRRATRTRLAGDAPLYPNALAIRPLIFALTAGGVLTALVTKMMG